MTFYTNSLWQHITDHAGNTPEKLALRDTKGAVCSYQSFVDAVDGYAAVLQNRGVKKGDRILFLERPSIKALQVFFALYRVGAVAVIADPAMGQDNFRSRVQISDCRFVVLDPVLALLHKIPGATRLARRFVSEIPDTVDVLPEIITLPRKSLSISKIRNEEYVSDTEDALIIFTSGTTSEPKGVVHAFHSLGHTLSLIKEKINTEDSDVFFSNQLHFSIIALISGAASVVDTETSFSPKRYIQNLESIKPTHTFMLPTEGQQLIEYLAPQQKQLPQFVRFVMFGSAPVLTGFVERFVAVTNETTTTLCIYGATEILPVSIATADEKLSFDGSGDYLGALLPGIKVEVVDDELLISGENLCDRYLLSAERLTHFSSGDLGYVTPGHKLVMTGRKKDMIIKNYHNVYPALFESTISRIPGVKSCALVGLYNHETQDEEIHLCIERNDFDMADSVFVTELQKTLRSGKYSIDSYALPDHVHIMCIPHSGRSRKPDKQALRRQLQKSI